MTTDIRPPPDCLDDRKAEVVHLATIDTELKDFLLEFRVIIATDGRSVRCLVDSRAHFEGRNDELLLMPDEVGIVTIDLIDFRWRDGLLAACDGLSLPSMVDEVVIVWVI